MFITVVDYNPNWPKKFDVEAKRLEYVLGDLIHHIHHIGSTAVPDLMAKPIEESLESDYDMNLWKTDENKYRIRVEEWNY